jgi:hypothetical protein
MSETLIKVNDWGTILDITVTELSNNNSMIVNLSAVTAIKIWLKQYNVAKKSVTGTFYTDGTDGRIKYVLKLGDIDTAGPCNMQVELTFGLAGHWYSNWVTFNVEGS